MEKSEYEIMYSLESSYWWFIGKQFLIQRELESLSRNLGVGRKILDIGSGTGLNLRILEKYGKVFGIERSAEAIGFLKKRGLGDIACADAREPLPFRNETFSAVACLDVLEHLDDDEFLLSEMYRVCKLGGNLVITVPAFQLFWSPHDVALHHRRRYTKQQLLGRIRNIQCEILKASYYNMVLAPPIMAFRKLKSLLFSRTDSRSDFFLPLPEFLNKVLTTLFKLEISLLRYLDYPFGVSLLVTLRKGGEKGDRKSE
jgi:SAM-dependent methyltransferase